MRMRIAVYVLLVLALGVVTALAEDISGKWTAEVTGPGGQTRETTFNFKVEGAKLTGTVTAGRNETPIADGKISGDEISFTVTMERQGNTIKMSYKGKVSGKEIKFTRSREGADRVQEFTAKRPAT